MFSALNRLIPFVNRSTRNAQPNNQIQEPALTQQHDDSSFSASWQTLSHHEADNLECKPEQSREPGLVVDPQDSTRPSPPRKSQRLLSGAISHLAFGPKSEYFIADDISNGRELVKIPAVSYKRNDVPPNDYHYVTDHIQLNPVPLNSSFSIMSGCFCDDDCSKGRCNCSSLVYPARYYDNKGRLSANYNVDAPEIIYECSAICKCNRKTCKNIVIQEGSKAKLVLFKTKSRGWGIRTAEDLKRGTFIGVYCGELIAAADSHKRQDDTYLFNLASTHIYQARKPESEHSNLTEVKDSDEQQATNFSYDQQTEGQAQNVSRAEDDQFVCDAKYFGNFTRFINHSCVPNVIGIRSYTTHQDSRFPYIAFFTNQNISAGTELTLNYGDNYWLVKCKRDKVYCLCKRSKCRFTRKMFPQTLKIYNQQRQKSQEL